MPPPCIGMSRPKRSCDPGPSISAAPGRCPLHQGQLGWNMLMPCEVCIALAFTDVPEYSASEGCSSGISPGATSAVAGALQQYAAPRSASPVPLEPPSQSSDGVPPPSPPPPPPIACFRHRGGGAGLCQTPVKRVSSWLLMPTLANLGLIQPWLVLGLSDCCMT